jgi:hypothetical protein
MAHKKDEERARRCRALRPAAGRGRAHALADRGRAGKSPKTGKARSLREIAEELERLGFVNGKGQRFAAAQVTRLIA